MTNRDSIEQMRQRFYASSPFDLGTVNDDQWRNSVDAVIGDTFGACAECGEPLRGIIDVHMHTENGEDVTNGKKPKTQTGETCPECGSAIDTYYNNCSSPTCDYMQ